MPRTLLPVNIRPHLVPFLFLEFPGIDGNFFGKKVKAVKVSTKNTLGKLIRLLAEKSDRPPGKDKSYSMYLSVCEREQNTEYFGKIYLYESGQYSFLYLPPEGAKMINDHLESIFRTAMLYYLDGWVEKEGEQSLVEGIARFMDKYNLWEVNFDPESLRRNYYRLKKAEKRLGFYATQAPNRVQNYE